MSRRIPVPRVSDASRFVDDFLLPQRPVIVTGLARQMPAFTRWTDEHLIAHVGDDRPILRLAEGRRATIHMRDFLRYLADPSAFTSKVGAAYLTDLYLRPRIFGPGLDVLAAEASCPLPRPTRYAERLALYAGPRGTACEMHQDVFDTQAWMAQLRGHKSWRLCAPQDLDLEIAPAVDAFSDAELPCDVHEALVEPGDVFYMPTNWWHQVRNEDATLSVFGHFSTFEQARLSLQQVQTSTDAKYREGWTELWRGILALETQDVAVIADGASHDAVSA